MNSRRPFVLLLIGFLTIPLLTGVSNAQQLSPESLHSQAYNQFWDGEYERAESTFRTLIERFPDSSVYWDARYGLARSLNKQGNLREAARHFRAVRRNHPDQSVRGDALFGQVEVAILQDKIIRAEQFLRTFLDVFPDHVLEPTAREQLKLIEEIDRSGPPARSDRSTPSTGGKEPSTDRPRQPRLKPAGDGDTSARDLIGPEASGPGTSDTVASGAPEMRRDGRPGKDSSDTPELDRESPSPSNGTRISPLGSEAAETDTSTGDTRAGRDSSTDDTSVSPDRGATEEPGGLITPEELAGTSAKTSGREPSPERTDTTASRDVVRPDTSAAGATDTRNTPGRDRQQTTSTDTGEAEPAPPEESEEDRLDRVRTLLERGALDEARQLVDTVLDSRDAGAEATFLGARVYAENPVQTDRVLEYVNRALRDRSDPPAEYHFLKTEVLLDANRNQEALASLSEVNSDALGDDPSEPRARFYYLRGRISLRLDQPDEAFFYFMDAVRAAPSSRWAKRSRQIIQDRL